MDKGRADSGSKGQWEIYQAVCSGEGVMITASPVRRVYYSEQTGYSVVVYKTNDPIPLQAVSEYCGTMPCFKAAGRQLPDTEGLLAELDGEWKENRYGWQIKI